MLLVQDELHHQLLLNVSLKECWTHQTLIVIPQIDYYLVPVIFALSALSLKLTNKCSFKFYMTLLFTVECLQKLYKIPALIGYCEEAKIALLN